MEQPQIRYISQHLGRESEQKIMTVHSVQYMMSKMYESFNEVVLPACRALPLLPCACCGRGLPWSSSSQAAGAGRLAIAAEDAPLPTAVLLALASGFPFFAHLQIQAHHTSGIKPLRVCMHHAKLPKGAVPASASDCMVKV